MQKAAEKGRTEGGGQRVLSTGWATVRSTTLPPHGRLLYPMPTQQLHGRSCGDEPRIPRQRALVQLPASLPPARGPGAGPRPSLSLLTILWSLFLPLVEQVCGADQRPCLQNASHRVWPRKPLIYGRCHHGWWEHFTPCLLHRALRRTAGRVAPQLPQLRGQAGRAATPMLAPLALLGEQEPLCVPFIQGGTWKRALSILLV